MASADWVTRAWRVGRRDHQPVDTPSRAVAMGGNPWWMLAMLTTLMVVSFLDRTILSLLVKPIKADLAMSDSQFALVYGFAFAIFFGLIGFPIARVVDRGRRKTIILAGVTVWALATLLSGLAQSFVILVICRMMLAVGEAALSPTTASLISDSFTVRRRLIANAVFAGGSQVGLHGSLAIGGLLVAAIGTSSFMGLAGWRLALVLAALPAILLAIIFAASVGEPPRSGLSAKDEQIHDVGALFRFLSNNRRLYACFLLGATGSGVMLFAYSAWMPELLSRGFGVDIATIGLRLGMTGLAAGLFGTFVVPFTASRLIGRFPSAPASLNALCAAGGCVSAILMPLQETTGAVLLLYGVTVCLLTGVANGTLVSLQLIAPRSAIGTVHSLGNIAITVLGLAIGPSAAAALSTAVGGTASLQPALVILAPLALIPSVGLFLFARRPVAAWIASVLAAERA